jgi:hypothetical protein
MRRVVKKILLIALGCGAVLWVTGLASNYYVAARTENELHRQIDGGYAKFRQYWLKAGSGKGHHDNLRPSKLPKNLQWLSRKQLKMTYHWEPDHYEIPFNNDKGYISVSRPGFLRHGWYVPAEGSIPWAFVVRRTMYTLLYENRLRLSSRAFHRLWRLQVVRECVWVAYQEEQVGHLLGIVGANAARREAFRPMC